MSFKSLKLNKKQKHGKLSRKDRILLQRIKRRGEKLQLDPILREQDDKELENIKGDEAINEWINRELKRGTKENKVRNKTRPMAK